MRKKRIILAGATGLVGKILYQQLTAKRYEIGIITRDVEKAKKSLPDASLYIEWADTQGIEKAIDGAYGVINLAGAPIVGKRWTQAYKQLLLDSRVKTTAQIVRAIHEAKTKPTVLINGSAVGYYGTVDQDEPFVESEECGYDFLARVCEAWEFEAHKAAKYGVRVVTLRTAIVLDKHEGALPQMIRPFIFFLGGPIGSGKQWFPWIHVQDEIGIICFSLENKKVIGPVNAVAPDMVTNAEFSIILGKMLHKPSLFPVPVFVLRIIFGEAAIVLTKGVQVSSNKISKLGYTFLYPKLENALKDILQK